MRVFTGAVVLLVFAIAAAYVLGLKQSTVTETPPEAPGWVRSIPTVQGITFAYPNPLTARYFSASEWPPLVEVTEGGYGCTAGGTDGPVPHIEERIIGGRPYCVSVMSEGAAGSVYRTYEYATERDGTMLRTVFTFRFVQCLNYDEPERAACSAEQGKFDPDGLAFGLIESVRFP